MQETIEIRKERLDHLLECESWFVRFMFKVTSAECTYKQIKAAGFIQIIEEGEDLVKLCPR
jgi:hypothetical protein